MSTVTPSRHSQLTVAWWQTATHWHDAAANRAMFTDLFAQHLPCVSADLVVLPEMFSTGFTMSSAQVAEPMTGPTLDWMQQQAQRWGVTLCGSVVIVDSGHYYNRFLWVHADGAVSYYDKRHRFRMAAEHEHYAAGSKRAVLPLGDWRILPCVCYDLRFPVWLRNRNDYDLLLCVANWPAARQDAWDALLPARAVENQCYSLGVNILGTDGNAVEYGGGSVLVGPDGGSLQRCGERPGFFNVTLDRQVLLQQRLDFPVWQDADDFQLARPLADDMP